MHPLLRKLLEEVNSQSEGVNKEKPCQRMRQAGDPALKRGSGGPQDDHGGAARPDGQVREGWSGDGVRDHRFSQQALHLL